MIIAGKERPFLFCLNSLKEFSRLEDLTIDETFNSLDKLNLDQTVNLIYCCFKYGAKKEGLSVDFNADDVGDWLNDDLNKIGEITKLMISQMPKSKNQKAPRLGA